MFRTTLLTVAVLVTTAAADDKKSAAPDNAMMEAMMKQATPGEHHKKLDPLAGHWSYTAKFWMAPGAPPMEMAGETKTTWVMENRFQRMEVSGPAQGGMPPFHGFGLTGYDNAAKKYQAIWVDNMTTAITHMSGEMDAAGKALTYHYQEFDPMTGKMAKAREVISITGPDANVTVFYKVMADGKEMKVGEIKATRKK